MKPNLQLRTCLITLLVFVLISISGGPAIWLIAKFIDMLGPVICAVLVMLAIGLGGVSWDRERRPGLMEKR